MTPAYPERERWLALGLLLLALAVAYALLVHPWWTVPMSEANQRVEELRERELISSAYLEHTVRVDSALGPLECLTYVIDPGHAQYCGGLDLETQAGIIARACGVCWVARNNRASTRSAASIGRPKPS